MTTPWAVILAAGRGVRLAKAGAPDTKQFLLHQGHPLFWNCAQTLARVPRIKGIVLVLPGHDAEEYAKREQLARSLMAQQDLGVVWRITPGGERRQDSVAKGLAELPSECNAVLVHDAARPFFSAQMVNELLQALDDGAKAAIPGLPVTDTIKQVAPNADIPLVETTLDRSRLMAVQTPQAFSRDVLDLAHERAAQENWEVTDDASMVEQLGESVHIVQGEQSNVKITVPEDLARLAHDSRQEDAMAAPTPITGWGYDVHRYGPGRQLKLGGELIQGPYEVVAHSDGDVLLHALTDALLGLLGGGDIGDRFPDSDPAFENLESSYFVDHVLLDIAKAGITLTHVDLTIIAQVPKLAPHKERIKAGVARLLALLPEQVSLKATTEEGLGFTGEKKGIKAVAVVSALRP